METSAGIDGNAPLDRQDDHTESLNKIDAALRRLDLGKFGHCLFCGDPISVVRLDRNPAIESCETCNED
jgi:RNA polymerase-binding transcription factor DksA